MEKEGSAERYKKAAYAFVALLAGYVIVRGFSVAATKPLWWDELCTLATASQPTLHEMWSGIARGFDSASPLFNLVERAALRLPMDEKVALRLPSILAFPFTLVCLFLYAKKRNGDLIACLCALLLLSSELFHSYAYEARGYSLAMGCIALAMVCYQRLGQEKAILFEEGAKRADEPEDMAEGAGYPKGWIVLLGVSLFLAECFHYYMVFSLVPFGLAEVTHSLKTRRVRWAVWVALVCATIPLLASLKFVIAMKAFYGPRIFFLHQVFPRVVESFGVYFATQREFGIALLLICIVGIVWTFWVKGGEMEPVEGMLLLGLSLLPITTAVLVKMLGGGFLNRYELATTFGMILGMGCLLGRLPRRGVLLFGIVLVANLGIQEFQFWRHPGYDPRTTELSARSKEELGEIRTFIERSGHEDLPVVFDSELIYDQFVHYAPAEWRPRIVYLTDEDREYRHDGTDTAVRLIRGLGEYLPTRLEEYGEFTGAHREFLVYSDPAQWALAAMLREGATAQLVRVDGERRMYLVKMREGAGQ